MSGALRAALVQLTASDDPEADPARTRPLVERAAAGGAALVLTPEVTNRVCASRTRQREVVRREEDPTRWPRSRTTRRGSGCGCWWARSRSRRTTPGGASPTARS